MLVVGVLVMVCEIVVVEVSDDDVCVSVSVVLVEEVFVVTVPDVVLVVHVPHVAGHIC